jgi:hypothetical protein
MARIQKGIGELDGPFVGCKVTQETHDRLEIVAPSMLGKRSRYLRDAIEEKLDRDRVVLDVQDGAA